MTSCLRLFCDLHHVSFSVRNLFSYNNCFGFERTIPKRAEFEIINVHPTKHTNLESYVQVFFKATTF